MTSERIEEILPRGFEDEPGPPEELYARVAAMIERAPAPGMPLRRRLSLVAAALPCAMMIPLVGHYVISGRSLFRLDMGSLPPRQFALELLLMAGLTIGATALSARPGRRGLGSTAWALALTAIAVSPVYAVVSLLWPLRSQDPEALAAAAHLHPWGLPCLAIAAVVGMLALGAFAWGLRHAAPVSAGLRGAALGAAAGAWAGFTLFVHCPASSLLHVVVSHVVPVAVFTLIGAIAVPQFVRL